VFLDGREAWPKIRSASDERGSALLPGSAAFGIRYAPSLARFAALFERDAFPGQAGSSPYLAPATPHFRCDWGVNFHPLGVEFYPPSALAVRSMAEFRGGEGSLLRLEGEFLRLALQREGTLLPKDPSTAEFYPSILLREPSFLPIYPPMVIQEPPSRFWEGAMVWNQPPFLLNHPSFPPPQCQSALFSQRLCVSAISPAFSPFEATAEAGQMRKKPVSELPGF